MDRESEYLLHLMGAYIRQEEPDARTDIDWPRLFRLAQIHCVTGVLGYLCASYPICPDEALRAQMRKICMGNIAMFGRRGALAEQFSQLLSDHGIAHIIMKGFVLRACYPVPELRTFSDIDIVIRPEDRQKSHQLLQQQGFQTQYDWEPVYTYIRGQEYYEMHTRIMETDFPGKVDFVAYFDRHWQYARPQGGGRYAFTPEFHFLYMLTHIAKHVVSSGAGVRMYMDVAAFIRKYGETLDWDWIRQELEYLHFGDFANTVLALTGKAFGVTGPIPLKPMEDGILEDFLAFTVNGGVYGRAERNRGALALDRESEGEKTVSRSGTLARRVFPGAGELKNRFPYLQDKPWLLPVAWVQRAAQARGKWKDLADEAQDILAADVDEVRRLQQLREDIGL